MSNSEYLKEGPRLPCGSIGDDRSSCCLQKAALIEWS